jgi:AraC family L-rhamnose operon transcriptional activator RhaR
MRMGEAFALNRYLRREVFATNPTPITAHRLVVEDEFAPHDHDVMIIVLADKGEGIHSTIYGHEPIRPGDVYILRPGMWHSFSECQELEAYVCCFGPELLQKELSWLLEDPALNYLFRVGPRSLKRKGVISLRLPPEPREACRRCLEGIMSCEGLEVVRARTMLIGHLLLFLGELARWAAPEVLLPGSKRPEKVHRVVIEGLRLIKDDLPRDWTLKELAEALRVEKSYVVRLFKAHTGLSPMAYLAHCRAERAATLLLTSDLSITEVAREVGWTDPNYFARRFKAHFGVSATTYRARFARGEFSGAAAQ